MKNMFYLILFCVVSLLGVFISSHSYNVYGVDSNVSFIGESLAEDVEESKYKRFECKFKVFDILVVDDMVSVVYNFLCF